MTDDEFAEFLKAEALPPAFALTLERVCRPLAAMGATARHGLGRTAVIGLCGAQGSGKSTIAAATTRLLAAEGLKAVTLSLDDLYLGREARDWLAGQVHRLLAVRGPPGTHDVALGCAVLGALATEGEVAVPRFDKATDERRPGPDWPQVEGPVDVVLLEGWCVGARPEPDARLARPVNTLEAIADADGRWRRYVDRQLAGPYQALFGRLDRLVLLAAPGFEVVAAWRTEQEHKLRARTGGGMSDVQVLAFVQHYERLTRWILDDMPGYADWTVPLAADRTPLV